jgi:hypothetical protein
MSGPPVSFVAFLLAVLSVGPSITAVAPQEGTLEPTRPKVHSADELRSKTEPEQERAAFFDSSGPTIWTLSPGERVVVVAEPPDPAAPAISLSGTEIRPRRPRGPLDAIQARICDSDAVVVGPVTSFRVLLNKSETFFFSDLTVDVEHWIRPNARDARILVSTLGGAAEIDGQVVRTDAVPVPPKNRPRIWYLRRFPRRQATRQQTGFLLNGPSEEIVTASQLASAVRRLQELAKSCSERPR